MAEINCQLRKWGTMENIKFNKARSSWLREKCRKTSTMLIRSAGSLLIRHRSGEKEKLWTFYVN